MSRFDVESGVNVLDYTFTLTYYVDGVEWKSFNTVEGFFEG